MRFDFENGADRRQSDSLKWQRYAGQDILPMWVADMDFAAPPAILEAIQRRTNHGVFGYTEPWPSLYDAIVTHLRQIYMWEIDPDWIVWIPGVVAAFNVACRTVGIHGDAVFTATPVYPPFLSAPRLSNRRLVTSPLLNQSGRWSWDFLHVEKILQAEIPKLWLLCHPHNPVGRVWSEHELRTIEALAEAHDVVICSDEIHCGLVLDAGQRHRPLASLSAALARRTITLMAPSKTFNIPGLGSAFAVIPDATLRQQYQRTMDGIMPHINTLGLVATEAAYRSCGEWHTALIEQLRVNANMVLDAIAAMPGLSMSPVEATYLAWIDCGKWMSERGISDPAHAFEKAGVGLSRGQDFALGQDASNFVRLNFGCPSGTLQIALERMRRLTC